MTAKDLRREDVSEKNKLGPKLAACRLELRKWQRLENRQSVWRVKAEAERDRLAAERETWRRRARAYQLRAKELRTQLEAERTS